MEARARAKWLMLKCVREADLDKQTLGDALADAMLAYAAEREAAAYDRAAEVCDEHGPLHCEVRLAILSLKESKG